VGEAVFERGQGHLGFKAGTGRTQHDRGQRIARRDQAAAFVDREEFHRTGDRVVAPGADRPAFIFAEKAVGAVFQQQHAACVAERAQFGQRLWKAKKVGDHQRLGAIGFGGEVVEVHAGVGMDAVEAYSGAQFEHRRDHRRAVVSRHQHGVAAADAHLPERKTNRDAAAGNHAYRAGVEHRARAGGPSRCGKRSTRKDRDAGNPAPGRRSSWCDLVRREHPSV
jgi:hypothetical protein